MTTTANEKKYNKWIVILSIVIPLVVAILFGVRLPNVEPLSFLPPIYATTNALTAVILIIVAVVVMAVAMVFVIIVIIVI